MFCLEDERETSIDCFPHAHRLGTEPASLGMCPDQESNPQPFGIQDNAPTNWTNWPGLIPFIFLDIASENYFQVISFKIESSHSL